ncbi:MAG: glucose-6-phosphate dehydrogenase assembly protein OpcA [Verrucomicrobia bacterium]|nr:glucose-6-phosphate dehydrogenase assembly protein OpcA [Verrucomicrobiota bacterium]
MPTVEDLARGVPVDIARINRGLKQLFEQEGEVLTKASLVNFAVYSEAPDALSFNSRLMSSVTQENACRVILLAANPASSHRRVQAWISAHCHISRAGSKQVCSEQIAFLLEGVDHATIQSIVFSNLDSDLPLYLWWQGQFPERASSQLWSWVDRLFFDSQSWREPSTQMQTLRHATRARRSRLVFCDLNWRRLFYLRVALAQSFDHPWAWEKISHVEKLTITYDPEYWTTAILLMAWLARQLGWSLRERSDDRYTFTTPERAGNIEVELSALPGPWVSRIQVHAANSYLELAWNGDFLTSSLSDHPEVRQLWPAGDISLEAVVREELSRGGEHHTYEAALQIAEQIWGR